MVVIPFLVAGYGNGYGNGQGYEGGYEYMREKNGGHNGKGNNGKGDNGNMNGSDNHNRYVSIGITIQSGSS